MIPPDGKIAAVLEAEDRAVGVPDTDQDVAFRFRFDGEIAHVIDEELAVALVHLAVVDLER